MSIPDIQGQLSHFISILLIFSYFLKYILLGVKDDVQFAVTRLDLSGFKLRKEGKIIITPIIIIFLS